MPRQYNPRKQLNCELAGQEFSGTRIVLVILLVLACAPAAVTAAPTGDAIEPQRTAGMDFQPDLKQLNHRAYTAADNAPGLVITIAQTNDGMLWLGSYSGLTRFDGRRFVRYPGPLDDPLPSVMIRELIGTPDGGLLIGYVYGGYSVLKDGRLTHFGLGTGSVAYQFALDRDGAVWVASNAGLERFKAGVWERVANESIPFATAVVVDGAGNLWVGTRDRILVRAPGEKEFREAARISIPSNVRRYLAASYDGSLWAIAHGAITQVRPPWTPGPAGKPIFLGPRAHDPLLFDDRGDLWIGGDVVRRIPRRALADEENSGQLTAAADEFSHVDGLTEGFAIGLFLDRERNVWLATSAGLNRFSRTNVVRLSLPLCFGLGHALAAGDAGALWAACAGEASAPGVVSEIRNGTVVSTQDTEKFTAAYRDEGGTVWFAGPKALGQLQGGRIVTTPLPAEASGVDAQAITRDRSGALWLSMLAPKGVYRFSDGQWSPIRELPTNTAATVEAVTSDDAVWFGYPGDKLARLRGKSLHFFTATDGLKVHTITALRAQGAQLWVGGELGLQRFDGTRFVPVLSASIDAFKGISGIVATENGDLWLNAAGGIVHIPRAELERATLDPTYRTQNETFDSLDGVPGPPIQIRPLPSAIETTDGRVWFGTYAGVVSIDPAHLVRNALPPPVKIWSLSSHDKFFPATAGLVLPAHSDSLHIDYSAGSLTLPERVRFRYHLEGLDRDWQDVGSRREAIYTNLGPGRYRFRVTAANNDGIWNEAGAALSFAIAPAFYQTKWFYALCALAVLAALALLVQLRIRQVTASVRERLEARLAERERIARDLHDTLLQGLQGLIWRFQSATNRIPPGEPARQLMEQSLDRADKLLEESRDKVKDLRPAASETAEFAQALASECEQLAQLYAVKCQVSIQGTRRDLHPIVREEGLMIVREALSNAFRHSSANNIEVEVTYDKAAFQLRIRDDGRGISAPVLEAGGTPGHFGLMGLRERAKKLGGHLEIWSKPDAGTEIHLRVPAELAYTRSQPGRDRSLFERFRSSNSPH